ncbi:MAG: pseudouridine-5-phosphate glycosidase [Anaerolineaceae bacterium 4572_78]|nr:MAG: pseudouridine-5-phosphate glycosidase [Anaerolineaceae bacterium 4572_78]
MFSYHPEVKEALATKKPIVALESTLITHGFSYPDNLNVAHAIEDTVREHGAVPATIAILNGQIKVGLTADQLEYLATTKNARKCSRRDLPLAIALKMDGGTTVAGTMVIAYQTGIEIFATGGIGGVHRGHAHDVSTDLIELGQTPITVVCAGMKAFLDLPASLEFLETQGVPILGYGTHELPAFYSRQSGLAIDQHVDNPQTVAEIIQARNNLKLKNAILVTVPVPQADEWHTDQAQHVIETALDEAMAKNITGKAITPFILERIAQISGGVSKQANKVLLINNASVASQIAIALHGM